MGTPRKSFNNFPPFNPRAGQYPSQSADYRSQQFGGQQTQQQGNFGFYEDKQGSQKSLQNTPHFYQNKSPQEPQRHRPYGPGRGFGRGGGFNSGGQQNREQNREQNRRSHQSRENNQSGNAFSQYFHPSMLEDPWRDLMERHEAIHGSSTSQTPKSVEAS